jgi:hypothetical protein
MYMYPRLLLQGSRSNYVIPLYLLLHDPMMVHVQLGIPETKKQEEEINMTSCGIQSSDLLISSTRNTVFALLLTNSVTANG